MSDASDEPHRFSKREYTISCIFTVLFVMLLAASYFDIATCPYNSSGGAATIAGFETPPTSVLSPDFSVVPCHTLDLVVWVYIGAWVYFMSYKFRLYRSQGYHYFLLDYCYFHNACLIALILWMIVKWESVVLLEGVLWVWFPADVMPVGTAVGQLTRDKLSFSVLAFFAILSGTFGPIVGATLIWKNALLFHSFDKMTSCYLHLAPAAVQGLIIHAALESVRHRHRGSRLRALLQDNTSFLNMLALHVGMFLVWQVYYHSIHEVRLVMRRREAGQPARCGAALVSRMTSYSWMMEKPPLGKRGPLYRLVTVFGTGRLQSTVMFNVTQLLIHTGFSVLGYLPICTSLVYVEAAWPLLAYTCFFFLLCIYNAAAINKSWISKLAARAKEADALRKELASLKADKKL